MTIVIKSHIKEVLDQLSVDYATGKHLNIISGNYGLNRPFTGFTDAVWRACTKILAANNKQVVTKFYELLSLIYGPKVTVWSNLSEDHPVGSSSLLVNNVSQFPDVGTIVLDRGLATEETLAYKFIDRYSNTIILDEVTTAFLHKGIPADAEALLIQASAGTATLESAAGFPLLGSFTAGTLAVLLSPGTEEEESVTLTDASESLNQVYFTGGGFAHTVVDPLPKVGTVVNSVPANSSLYVYLDDTSWLPKSGVLVLEGPVYLTYVNVDYLNNIIQLKRPHTSAITSGTFVQALPNTRKAALAGVQILGAGWELYQGQKHKVEIEIPLTEAQLLDLKTASYIHGPTGAAPADAVVAKDIASGSFYIKTSDVTDWPLSGVLSDGSDDLGYSLHRATIRDNGDIQGQFYIPQGTTNQLVIGNTLEFQDDYDVLGPYVYDTQTDAPFYSSQTDTVNAIPAPTKLSLSVVANANPAVLEVEDATNFPGGAFVAQLGLETLNVTGIYTAAASATTVGGNALAGATLISVVNGAAFPNAQNFRVLIGGSDPEIVFVSSRTGNDLNLADPLQFAKTLGDSIELVTDCLVVSQIDTTHGGIVSQVERSPLGTSLTPLHLVNVFDFENAEVVRVLYSSVTLSSTAGFDINGGTAVIRFADRVLPDLSIVYTSVVGSTLTFTPPIVFDKEIPAGTAVFFASQKNEPSVFGTDYPLRMPVDNFSRILFLLDLVRAAGIEVLTNFKLEPVIYPPIP